MGPDTATLKTVLADNRANIARYDVLPRKFNFDGFSNYVLVGIRRAGKSYLLYQRIRELLAEGMSQDEIMYVNFEDERLSGMTALDLNRLLELHIEMYGKEPVLFLDEIQNIHGWEKFARRMADTKHRVYITGSNAKMLSNEIQSTLGGRYIPVEVYPYDFAEFLEAKGISLTADSMYASAEKASILREYNDYFHNGGFPESISMPVKRDYLTGIYQKIYLGDIAARHSVSNTFALRIIFRKLAESVKQPLSFNRITHIVTSTGVKTGTSTVINYIEYAKEAWLITPVHNFAGKLADKETNPKYYFTDNGLINILTAGDETTLFENLVAVSLLRKYGRENAVYFYNRNIEIDFYIPEAKTAIQACYNMASPETFKRETEALTKASSVLPDCERLLILTNDEERTLTVAEKVISVIPLWKWLLQDDENA